MTRYTGLPPALKESVFTRDNFRCRWCGQTSAYGYDAHHIEYRRGYSYDVLENLVTLCRSCHDFVHDSYQIAKSAAQEVLMNVISTDASTGLAVWRGMRKETDERPTGPVGRMMGLD